MSRRAVFLDRDGVLNAPVEHDGRLTAPWRTDELRLLPGVPAACEALRQAGYLLIVVSNQPDVARGDARREAVEHINAVLRTVLPLDDIRVCFHDNQHRCPCRKPAPGMIMAAAAEHDIDLSQSVMVGDRWVDVEAGRRAGCRTVLVGELSAESPAPPPGHHAASLDEAVATLVAWAS